MNEPRGGAALADASVSLLHDTAQHNEYLCGKCSFWLFRGLFRYDYAALRPSHCNPTVYRGTGAITYSADSLSASPVSLNFAPLSRTRTDAPSAPDLYFQAHHLIVSEADALMHDIAVCSSKQ